MQICGQVTRTVRYVSSIFVNRVIGHASTSARNRYVIDVGLVVENVSTVSSLRGNNDRWLDRAESSFKAYWDPACVLVDFIRETFSPLLPGLESASRGKIGISSRHVS